MQPELLCGGALYVASAGANHSPDPSRHVSPFLFASAPPPVTLTSRWARWRTSVRNPSRPLASPPPLPPQLMGTQGTTLKSDANESASYFRLEEIGRTADDLKSSALLDFIGTGQQLMLSSPPQRPTPHGTPPCRCGRG